MKNVNVLRKIFFLLISLSTSFIIAQVGNVGINTATPSATLDIVSSGIDGTTKALKVNNSATTPKEMVTVLNNGNTGIGFTNPLYNLEIGDFLNNGSYFSLSQTGTNANGQSAFNIFSKRSAANSLTNFTSKGWKLFTLSDAYTANPALANSFFLEGWTNGVRKQNIFVAKPNGNIGFGIQDPTAKVHIQLNPADPTDPAVGFRLTDGTQGVNKVLTSDADGNAKWDNQSSQFLQQNATNTTDITLAKGAGNFTNVPGLTGFTAQSTGKYLIYFHCFFRADSSTSEKAFYFCVYQNGTQIKGPETYSYVVGNRHMAEVVPLIIDVNAGDLITYNLADGTLAPITLTIPSTLTLSGIRNFIEVVYIGK